MSENKKKKTDEEIVAAFEYLFDFSLVPNTLDEADEIIRDAGIAPDAFRDKMQAMTAKILSESPLNWRNQDEREIEAKKASINSILISEGLSKNALLAAINSIQAKLHGVLPSAVSMAHRNLREQSEQDLAFLLQELRYIAKDAGISLEENE